jgi:hypothetical protein
VATETAPKTDPKTDGKTTKTPKEKPTDAQRREKFRELAQNRVSFALAKIKPIGSLANPTNYLYKESDVEFIRRTLLKRVNDVCDRLLDALKSGKAASATTEFTLPEE